MRLTSYLVFNGQAEEAANFYADALGGKIANFFRYDAVPPSEEMPVPEESKHLILHCCIEFPGGTMSVSDTMPPNKCDFGNKGHILTIDTATIAQAEEVFAKLSQGAQSIEFPLGETYFATRYGELIDRFGVMWAVMFCTNNCDF